AHRDDSRPKALQKYIHHDQHQDHRLKKRVHNLVHRGFDGQGGVERDVIIHIGWKPCLGGLEDLLHVVRGFDRVGTGGQVNADRSGGRFVQTSAQVVSLRAEFNAANILYFHLRSVRIGANDYFLKLLWVLEQAERADVELALGSGWRGFGTNPAG